MRRNLGCDVKRMDKMDLSKKIGKVSLVAMLVLIAASAPLEASLCPNSPPGVAPWDPGIPSGSLCRGACGGDCPSTCRDLPDISICVSDGEHDFVCKYGVIECGSHQGCREHDACYDDCATAPRPALCRRGCDLACISNYGIGDCNNWRIGGDPYDSWLKFSYPPVQTACVGSTPYCVDGKCVECRTNADCDDKDPRTIDKCEDGKCKYTPRIPRLKKMFSKWRLR
jgi:hypothetical protein